MGMGRVVAFFGMVLRARGVLTEVLPFRIRPKYLYTYFIRSPAAEYAMPKPNDSLVPRPHPLTARTGRVRD